MPRAHRGAGSVRPVIKKETSCLLFDRRLQSINSRGCKYQQVSHSTARREMTSAWNTLNHDVDHMFQTIIKQMDGIARSFKPVKSGEA